MMEQIPNTAGESIDPAIVTFIERSGLVAMGSSIAMAPLTGGVASDIWKVTGAGRSFVVKKALARLRVAREWNAPVSRNASEVEWMLEAARIAPGAVPEILAHDRAIGAYAMTFLDPANHPVWKAELRAGRCDPAFAAAVGEVMARIHSATAGSVDVARRFDNDVTFHSIRLEPYLEATALAHPDLADPLFALSRETLDCKKALVHGDISPKNILVGPRGPVILDAECAWYGDPAFDLAFCLNHLLLKCLWAPASCSDFLACFDSLAQAYLREADWEDRAELESRAASLLPALFLARVDGKSPVEYVTGESDTESIRRTARPLILTKPHRLASVRDAWAKEITA
jgi:aminoglycoside phosphotransferase (APT) family kinase protein